MDVFHWHFGNSGCSHSQESSLRQPPNQGLPNYLLYVEDHATIFFWQGIALPLFVFWDNCEFHPFKICKIVRIEEPIVGLWEKWWDCVTQSETVRVERSGFSFNISGNLDTSFWLLRDHMSGNKAHSFCLVCSYIMHPVHMWFLAS